MHNVVRRFAAIALLVLVSVGSSSAQLAPPLADNFRQAVTLWDADGLTIRCSVKKVASLADDDFIRLEFQNDRDKPIALDSSDHYSIEAEVTDRKTGKFVFGASGIADGDPAELVFGTRKAWEKHTHIEVPRGKTVNATQPSVSAARSLRPVPADGWHITATVKLLAHFDGHRQDQQIAKTVEFDWRRPDAAGIEHLQQRVRQLLNNTADVQETPLIAVMLKIPEVGSSVPVADLLKALDTMRDPFSGRENIVDILSADHHAAPEVLEYYLGRLKATDYNAIRDLCRSDPDKGIWDDRFIDPLVAVLGNNDKINASGRDALNLLDRHSQRWAANVKIRQTLSGELLLWPSATQIDRALPGVPDFEILAKSHDPKLIPMFRPFLANQAVIHDFTGDAGLSPSVHVAPIRACDAAYNGICVLRGTPKDCINFTNWYEVSKVNPRKLVPRDPAVELQRRDQLIAKMRQVAG